MRARPGLLFCTGMAAEATARASGPVAAPTHVARLSRGRHWAVWGLIVAASLLGLLLVLATWVNRQMVSDSSWNKTSTQIVQDGQVRSALSVYLVNELYDNVNVAGALEQRLPTNLRPLAAPAAAALRQPAAQGVDFLLARPRVQQAFVDASALAHRELVNVLENKTGAGIQTGNGTVTLDLSALVKDLGTQLGLPSSALDKIPPDTGVITVMHSNQLSAAQTGFRALRILSIWLFVLVMAMFGLALYLATGIRRRTLRNIGWAFVFVGILTVVARNQIGNYAVTSLSPIQYRGPANHIWVIGTSTLGEIGWATVFYGAIGIFGAVLAGPTRAATAVRRWIAPTVNDRPGIAAAAVAFVYLLLIMWGGTHALRTPFGILILGGLLTIGVVAFRRESMREFPDTGAVGSPLGALTAAAGRVHASRKPASTVPTHDDRSTAEELDHLGSLRESGVLTDEEFTRAKERVLA